MSGSPAVLRAARPRDVGSIADVIVANDEPPPGEPAMPAAALLPYIEHVVRHGQAVVAEVDGEVVGFGAGISNGRFTHVADLYVMPSHHGTGLGGRLLADALGEAWPRTTFSSDDPRAMPLYARAGMAALWPNLYLSGDPGSLPRDGGLDVSDTSFEEIARLEAEWFGFDRAALVTFWQTLPDGRAVVVRDGSAVVAAAIVRRRLASAGGWVDRASVAPDADPVPPLLAILRVRPRGDAQGELGACVPGPSPLLPIMLNAGYRVRDRDTFMSSDPSLLDPHRHLPNAGIL